MVSTHDVTQTHYIISNVNINNNIISDEAADIGFANICVSPVTSSDNAFSTDVRLKKCRCYNKFIEKWYAFLTREWKSREKKGRENDKVEFRERTSITGFNDGGGQIYRRGFIWTGCIGWGVRFALVINLI